MASDETIDEVFENGPVQVHRFNRGNPVTIGPSGWSIGTAPARQAVPKLPQPKFSVEQLTLNGKDVGGAYYWSQDSQQVIVSIPLPAGTKAKGVLFDLDEKRISVSLNSQPLLEGETPLPIDTAHDYTDWEVVDWEPGPTGRRLLRITLKKKVPHDLQVILWWPKLLVSETEAVDPGAISGRRESAHTFRETWEAAHQQFKERMKEVDGTEEEEDKDVVGADAGSEVLQAGDVDAATSGMVGR